MAWELQKVRRGLSARRAVYLGRMRRHALTHWVIGFDPVGTDQYEVAVRDSESGWTERYVVSVERTEDGFPWVASVQVTVSGVLRKVHDMYGDRYELGDPHAVMRAACREMGWRDTEGEVVQ